MLFYTAGNVYYSTHTRDMNKLGGLIQFMPFSGLFFLVGSLSICAIPPFSGFISEFLVYKSVFQTIGTADFTTSMMILVVILSLVVIGGLSVYTFTKAFGLSFLGSNRGSLGKVREVPGIMKVSGSITIVLILIISLSSPWVVSLAGEISSLFVRISFNRQIVQDTLPSFEMISKVNVLIMIAIGLVFLLRRIFQNKSITTGPTWGCGYSAGDYRHQYTANSYSAYIRDLAGPAVATSDTYSSFKEIEIFPGKREFKVSTRDIIEEELITKPVEKGMDRMMRIGWAQTGKIGHYLVYPLVFLLIIMLLTRIGII